MFFRNNPIGVTTFLTVNENCEEEDGIRLCCFLLTRIWCLVLFGGITSKFGGFLLYL